MLVEGASGARAPTLARSSYRDPVSYYGPGEPDYEPYREPDEPAPTPATGSTALLVVLVSVLVVVLCGGGVAALYLIGSKDRQPVAAGSGPATPAATNRPSSASPSGSSDPTAIIKGQCVQNVGTEDAPVLKVVACGPGTFQVLARIDGTIDTTKCKQVAGSTHHYFYDTTPDTLDFILCLKKT
jgi:hypothetical protein